MVYFILLTHQHGFYIPLPHPPYDLHKSYQKHPYIVAGTVFENTSTSYYPLTHISLHLSYYMKSPVIHYVTIICTTLLVIRLVVWTTYG